MQENKKNIKVELEDLGALELAKLKKAELKIPLELQNQLLDKIDFDSKEEETHSGNLRKLSWAFAIAATLLISFFIWSPTESEDKLSIEALSDAEIEMYLYDRLEELEDEDLMTLASNEISMFEFMSIQDAYFEEEILSNDEYDYDDLF